MKPIYQIVQLKKDLFNEYDLDLSLLDIEFTNLYVTGLNFICKLESKTLPILNRRIAIKQILNFLKHIEMLLNISTSDVVEIPQDYIINIFNRNTYVDFLKLLNEMNIVKSVPYEDGTYYNCSHRGGVLKVKRYKLSDDYKNDELCIVIMDDKNDIKYEFDGKYDKKFIKTISNTVIDIKNAIIDEVKYKKSHNSLRTRLSVLFTLYDKRYIKKGFKVDRVFHSLTNISKVSRKYLSVDGLRFNNIDIVNCQPLLLCYYLIKNDLNVDESYINDCEVGTLYDKFIVGGRKYIDKEYIIKGGEIVAIKNNIIEVGFNLSKEEYDDIRSKIKVLLYKSIFFDFKPETDISISFKEIYPIVFSVLENMETNELKMACRLQNIEAEIFNNLKPNKSKYYFTLFDAIYFTSNEDTGSLMVDIINKFSKMNLVPKLKYNDDIFIN